MIVYTAHVLVGCGGEGGRVTMEDVDGTRGLMSSSSLSVSVSDSDSESGMAASALPHAAQAMSRNA